MICCPGSNAAGYIFDIPLLNNELSSDDRETVWRLEAYSKRGSRPLFFGDKDQWKYKRALQRLSQSSKRRPDPVDKVE